MLGAHDEVAHPHRLHREHGGKGHVRALAAPEIAGHAAQEEGEAGGGQHQVHHRAADQRPERQPLGGDPDQRGHRDRADQGRPVRQPEAHVERPGQEAREHEPLAVGEVDHGGRPVDDDQPERHQGVDAPVREPARQEVDQHAEVSGSLS